MSLKKSGNGKGLSVEEVGVLLIDMQPYFLREHDPEATREQIMAQQEVLGICVERDIPLVVLEYYRRGKTDSRLIPYIEKVPRNRFMEKRKANGFCDTPLHDTLLNWEINYVFLMGVRASICVRETGQGALERGLGIITSEQVIADHKSNEPLERSRLFYIRNGIYTEKIGDLPFLGS